MASLANEIHHTYCLRLIKQTLVSLRRPTLTRGDRYFCTLPVAPVSISFLIESVRCEVQSYMRIAYEPYFQVVVDYSESCKRP